MNQEILKKIKNKMIVSCQGYDENTFHTAEDMLMMANAAFLGGCAGFRLNSPEHVKIVRETFPDQCIIGIWKRESEGSNVYITPDVESVMALKEAGADIIALDATKQKNHLGDFGWQTIQKVKAIDPSIVLMADCSTFEEAKLATEAGVDIVSTTMSGYTSYTADRKNEPDYELIKECKEKLDVFVICEGKIWNREEALKCFKCKADAIVVGTAITNPKLITKHFIDYLKENKVWES